MQNMVRLGPTGRAGGIPLTRVAVLFLLRNVKVRGQALTGRNTKVLGLTPSLVLPLLLLFAVSVAAQSASQCKEANEQAIVAFKATLPEMSEHDRATAEALIDELERLIKESRAQGVDECIIWQEITRRVWRS